jgi:hypothetical protein
MWILKSREKRAPELPVYKFMMFVALCDIMVLGLERRPLTMAIRYKVTLTPEERDHLENLTKKGKQECRTYKLAKTLLLCDSSPDGPGWETRDICVALTHF